MKEQILADVEAELERAEAKFSPFGSGHEGYAVILEELDELWKEIKNNKFVGSRDRQRREAIQVAAMACRFVLMLDIEEEVSK